MSKQRIYEYAKELNLKSKDVIDELKKMNVEVSNHMQALEDDQIAQLNKKFKPSTQSNNKANASKADKPAQNNQKQQQKNNQKPNKNKKQQNKKNNGKQNKKRENNFIHERGLSISFNYRNNPLGTFNITSSLFAKAIL